MVDIRKANLDDIDKGLLKEYIEAYGLHQNNRPDIFPNLTEDELKNNLVRFLDKLEILVAIKNDQVIGYIVYQIREDNYKSIFISQLMVCEEFRNQGIAKSLIDSVKNIGLENDCKNVELNCWAFNKNALDMYDHLNFQKQKITYEINLK